MQEITLNGTLSLDENTLDRMNYIITSLIDGKETSLTDILETIHDSKNSIDKLVEIRGRIYDNNHLFYGFGKLKFCIDSIRDKYKIKGYFCGDMALSKQLYELIGRNIEILVRDYSDSIGEFIDDLVDASGISEDIQNGKTSKES